MARRKPLQREVENRPGATFTASPPGRGFFPASEKVDMSTETVELPGLTILRLAAPAASSILTPGTVRLRPAWEGVTKLTPAGVYRRAPVD